jgi:hypothetical protein
MNESISLHIIVTPLDNGDFRIYSKECNAEYVVNKNQVEREVGSLAKFWWAAQEISS